MAIKDNSLIRVETHREGEESKVEFFESDFRTPSSWLYEDTYHGVDQYTGPRSAIIYVSRVPANQREALNKILY